MFLANVVVPCLFKCKPELFRRLPLMLLCLISPQPLSAHNLANSALTIHLPFLLSLDHQFELLFPTI